MADEQISASEPESTTNGSGAAGEAGAADPYGAPADPHEGAVPPGYDWPTHGGYLGCLMGLVAACLFAGFVGSLVIGLISVTPLGSVVATPFARIALLLLAFVVCFGVLGRTGWVLGKRFYREYPDSVAPDAAVSSPPAETAGTDEQREKRLHGR